MNEKPKSTVVKIHDKQSMLDSEKKWGVTTMKCRFNIVPALLLRAQRRLGISPTQMALIIQITDFWWDYKRWPWATYKELANRLNVSEKVIQRNMAALEKRGYVKRITRIRNHRRIPNGYDLTGLIEKLQKLAPIFLKAADEKKEVAKKGASLDALVRVA